MRTSNRTAAKTAPATGPTIVPGAPYLLAPGLDPANYVVTPSFKGRDLWRAMTYDGQGDDRRGDMAKVGYVWISSHDDTIIPLSRGDEHHHGSDTLRDLKRRGRLPVDLRTYMPVWIHGRNVAYGTKEIPTWITVLRKFLAWGGPDALFQGYNDLSGLMMTSSLLVASGGAAVPTPGRLAPMGGQLVETMETLAQALALHAAGGSAQTARDAHAAAKLLLERYATLRTHTRDAIVPGTGLATQRRRVAEAARVGDVASIGEAMFGFGSFKRKIHEDVRRCMERRERGEWAVHDPDLEAFWGDLGYAEHRLTSL